MWAIMCVCHHVCHMQARSCLSTGWALNRCFAWFFGTVAVLAQGGGGGVSGLDSDAVPRVAVLCGHDYDIRTLTCKTQKGNEPCVGTINTTRDRPHFCFLHPKLREMNAMLITPTLLPLPLPAPAVRRKPSPWGQQGFPGISISPSS